MANTEQLIVELSAKVDQYNREIKGAMDKTDTHGKRGAKALKDVESASTSLNKIGSRALVAFAGVAGSVFATGKLIKYADAYTSLQNRIRTVLDPQQDLNNVTSELLALANETRSSLESTSTLYARLKRNTTELGLSQQDLIDVTKTINQSFAVSGASATEAAAAITQLSQGLASGTLRGDEFNSVAEQAPVILEAVAAATGKSRGELRELAADGQISADVLIKSLQAYSGVIENDFSKANLTAEQAQERLNNNFTVFVGELDKATGFTQGAVDKMDLLSGALETMQAPILDTIEYFRDLAGVIENEMGDSSEGFSEIASKYEGELATLKELFDSFVFALQTGVLVVPVAMKSAVEVAIAGMASFTDSARVVILEMRKKLAGAESDEGKVIQMQIDAIGNQAEATLDAVIEKNKEKLAGMGTVLADFEIKMAEERLARLEEEGNKEAELLREQLERQKAIREEFAAMGAGSVELPDSDDNEKKDDKRVKKQLKNEDMLRKARFDTMKSSLAFASALTGGSEKAAKAIWIVQQGLAAGEAFASTQAASMRALAELGPVAGPPVAAAIETKGYLSVAAIMAAGIAGAVSGGGSGGGVPTPSLTSGSYSERGYTEANQTLSINADGNTGSQNGQVVFLASEGDQLGKALTDWLNGAMKRGTVG